MAWQPPTQKNTTYTTNTNTTTYYIYDWATILCSLVTKVSILERGE
jgi:hypothetical protein